MCKVWLEEYMTAKTVVFEVPPYSIAAKPVLVRVQPQVLYEGARAVVRHGYYNF
jgi:hypothetical protein